MALSQERLGKYNPEKPTENRITDIGPRHFWDFFPLLFKRTMGNGCTTTSWNRGSWSTSLKRETRFLPLDAAVPGS